MLQFKHTCFEFIHLHLSPPPLHNTCRLFRLWPSPLLPPPHTTPLTILHRILQTLGICVQQMFWTGQRSKVIALIMSYIFICSTPSENSPYYQTTPTKSNPTNQSLVLNMRSSVQETHDWLAQNRFTSYISLFANYTGVDLLRLTRRDLIELCGAADGIRLFNALRSRTVKVIYITMGQEKGVFLQFR